MPASARIGGGTVVGSIGTCAQCRNKAEVAVYPYDPVDNPQPHPEAICETCYRENVKLEHSITDRGGNRPESHNAPVQEDVPLYRMPGASTPVNDPFVEERARYLAVIVERADDAWVDRFIAETLAKSVMKFDWQQVIQSPRWFSVLDLRKFALELDPKFEKPKRSKRNRRA